MAWVFADQRFGPAEGVAELEIDNADLRWDPNSWQANTNWSALVARAVDAVGGRGLVECAWTIRGRQSLSVRISSVQ